MASRKAPPTLDDTRETPVIDVGAARRGEIPAEKPTAPALPDDLAQTIEAPAAPRLALMDAAEVIIAEAGISGATPDAVARAASLDVEMFHAVFPDDGSLLRALHERFCAQALRIVVEAAETAVFEHVPTDACIDRTLRSLVDVMLGRWALLRAVLLSGDPRAADTTRKWLAAVATRVGRALESQDPRPSPNDLSLAFVVASAIVHDTLLMMPPTVDRDGVRTLAVEAAGAFLASRGSAKPGR